MKRLICASALLATLPLWAAEPAAVTATAKDAAMRTAQDLQPAVKTSAAAPQGVGRQAPPAAATRGTRRVQDRIELDATQITGNRELPRVLYVVPWKRSDLGDLTARPANSLLDEVLAPVDRDVFRRQNRYYDALKPDTAAGSRGNSTEVEK